MSKEQVTEAANRQDIGGLFDFLSHLLATKAISANTFNIAWDALGRCRVLLAERDALKAEVERLSGKTQSCHECERRQWEIDRLTKQYTRFADLMAAPLLVVDPPPPISQAEINNLRHLVDVLRNEWRSLIAGRLPESAHKDVLRRLEALEQAIKKI